MDCVNAKVLIVYVQKDKVPVIKGLGCMIVLILVPSTAYNGDCDWHGFTCMPCVKQVYAAIWIHVVRLINFFFILLASLVKSGIHLVQCPSHSHNVSRHQRFSCILMGLQMNVGMWTSVDYSCIMHTCAYMHLKFHTTRQKFSNENHASFHYLFSTSMGPAINQDEG